MTVDWHLPRKGGGYHKRRFMTTSTATGDLLRHIADTGATWAKAAGMIHHDDDARAVADRFVAEGYGSVLMGEHVR